MPTDLAAFIATAPLADTHEHQCSEQEWLDRPADILLDLFQNYVTADLHVAGAGEALGSLYDSERDVADRFAAIEPAWRRVQHTGYGEAVSHVARLLYDLDELTPAGLAAAAPRAGEYAGPGQRLRILREVAGLDHVQIDDKLYRRELDQSGPDFFLYDLNWRHQCTGEFDLAAFGSDAGIEIRDLESLREAMAAVFARHAPLAVAVKAQHAYTRTLRWAEPDEGDVGRLLSRRLAGQALTRAEYDVFGDWCWARGVELSIAHHLPFKIHCGYYAGTDSMPVDRIRAGHLCPLLARYPQAQFVLMHAAWPYTTELVALAKHYRNVVSDCCWAWSMNPLQVSRFVREQLHAAPLHKLLIFGGDTRWPTCAVGYAWQCRRWLTKTLQAEVDEHLLTERQALDVARQVMLENQVELFNLDAKRQQLRSTAQRAVG